MTRDILVGVIYLVVIGISYFNYKRAYSAYKGIKLLNENLIKIMEIK